MNYLLSRKEIFAALALVICLYCLALVAFHIEGRSLVEGDTPTYLQAIQVLGGTHPPADFMPNRILTSFLSLESVRVLAAFTGNPLSAWFALNSLFFFALGLLSFVFFMRLFENRTTAFLGTIAIVGNYDVYAFGIRYLMDIGGYAFYLASILALLFYVDRKDRRFLFVAVACASVGGLFKEYAFVALLPIAIVLIVEHGRNFVALVRASWLPALIACIPVALVHTAVFLTYHYTYLDWYRYNTHQYAYHAQFSESVKSVGATLQLLLIPAVLGVFYFLRSYQKIELDRRTFLLSIIPPAFVALAWPSVTERLMFLAVPTAAVFACLFFKRHGSWWPIYMLGAAVYVAIAFTTDSFTLSAMHDVLHLWAPEMMMRVRSIL